MAGMCWGLLMKSKPFASDPASYMTVSASLQECIMAAVTIYTKYGCPFCQRALALLTQKGAAITDIEAATDPVKRAEMNERSGRNTFPQIFIGETFVGGCDDLMALEARGGVDPLLAA
jgi:glutaredoxin 3